MPWKIIFLKLQNLQLNTLDKKDWKLNVRSENATKNRCSFQQNKIAHHIAILQENLKILNILKTHKTSKVQCLKFLVPFTVYRFQQWATWIKWSYTGWHTQYAVDNTMYTPVSYTHLDVYKRQACKDNLLKLFRTI